MLEILRSSTFRLRMPHIWSIGFRSGDMLGQSITFTLSFFGKAVIIIMLEYYPAAQSPKGGGHALLQYVTVHVGIHSSPVLAALMQPQTMTLQCLTVGKSNQISLLSHIMYTSVLMAKFLGTRLCAMAVQVSRYEKCTIYISNNIHILHNIHISTIYNRQLYTIYSTHISIIYT